MQIFQSAYENLVFEFVQPGRTFAYKTIDDIIKDDKDIYSDLIHSFKQMFKKSSKNQWFIL